mmetsp:Transcript_30974/g.80990  ORF Transcript_30974/g.80990 Transcript_30974/m.80990 type:complete len:207 (+) Transcript_30974:653-1273(+)
MQSGLLAPHTDGHRRPQSRRRFVGDTPQGRYLIPRWPAPYEAMRLAVQAAQLPQPVCMPKRPRPRHPLNAPPRAAQHLLKHQPWWEQMAWTTCLHCLYRKLATLLDGENQPRVVSQMVHAKLAAALPLRANSRILLVLFSQVEPQWIAIRALASRTTGRRTLLPFSYWLKLQGAVASGRQQQLKMAAPVGEKPVLATRSTGDPNAA